MASRTAQLCLAVLFLVFLHPAAPFAQPVKESPKIDPEADRVLKEMSLRLAGLGSFAAEAEDTVDFVLDSGQKIQLSHRRWSKVRRPNKLAAEVDGDDAHRKMWYNGETLTFLDADHNVYAVADAPGTIGETIEFVEKTLEIHVPLGDLLASDPYQVLTARVKSGTYLGRHRVGSRKCHHLAFTQEHVDWQIWIDAEGSPLPRKVLITYKKQPGQPQYTVVISKLEENPELTDEEFEFTPPEGATEVEFLTRTGLSRPAEGGGGE